MARTLSESWLQLEQNMGGRQCLSGGAEELRAQFAGMASALLPLYPPPSSNVETKDELVGSIPVRVYKPKNATGPLPLGIYAHGGGYVLGDLNSEDLAVRLFSENNNMVFVSVDYRLAPEAKAPAQLEDMIKAAEWACDNASSLGADPTRIITMGTSAGGGLALSLGRKIKIGQTKIDAKALKGIAAQVPITLHPDNVPAHLKSKYTAYEENAKDVPMINKATMESFYSETGVSPTDESYFTALDEASFKLYPPTYMNKCGFDPLRDDTSVMEEGLKAAGVPVKVDTYAGFPHCFWMVPTLQESQTCVQNTMAGLEWIKSQM